MKDIVNKKGAKYKEENPDGLKWNAGSCSAVGPWPSSQPQLGIRHQWWFWMRGEAEHRKMVLRCPKCFHSAKETGCYLKEIEET